MRRSASKRISLTQRSLTVSSNLPGVLEKDVPARKLDRLAAELEIHVVHGHPAVVEHKSAVHVFHGQLDHTPRVDARLRGSRHLEAHVRLGPGHDHDMGVVVAPWCDVDLGLDIAATRWIDRGPAFSSKQVEARLSAHR